MLLTPSKDDYQLYSETSVPIFQLNSLEYYDIVGEGDFSQVRLAEPKG